MAQKKNEKTAADEVVVKTEEVTQNTPEDTAAPETTAPVAEKPAKEPAKLTNVMLPIKTPTLHSPGVVTADVEHSGGSLLIVKRLPHGEGLPNIAYQTEGAAGMDLYAAIPAGDEVKLPPFSRVLIPTGLSMEIPVGFEGQVRPRSGLALKQGLTCLNSPGTIDSDYRGEVGVILYNASNNMARIKRGDRIAQIVFAAVARLTVGYSDELSETARGAGGYGSTGV